MDAPSIPFGSDFARYYDLLYSDKDYEAECDLIETLFREANTPVRSLLDVGCGTGGHALILAGRGYEVCGVDRSEPMLQIARQRAHVMQRTVDWKRADIRTLDLGRRFDACCALFAVLSFQINNVDIRSALRALRRHIEPRGLLVADVWYGPAVLVNGPETRLKVADDGDTRLLRYSVPELDTFHQTNVVHQNIIVIDRRAGRVLSEYREAQRVRFYFAQEIDLLLDEAGFELVRTFPFPDATRAITHNDWNLGLVARVKDGSA